jgi:hypothetical protein
VPHNDTPGEELEVQQALTQAPSDVVQTLEELCWVDRLRGVRI